MRPARPHDARHTAATVLLLLGVDRRVVMDIMGWSTITMAERYEHVTAQLRHDVAQNAAVRNLAGTLPEPWCRQMLRMLDDQ